MEYVYDSLVSLIGKSCNQVPGLADPASKAPQQMPKKSHAVRNIGVVLVVVAVLVTLVVSGSLGSSVASPTCRTCRPNRFRWFRTM